MERRDFLALGVATALAHASGFKLFAQSPAGTAGRRRLVCHWEARKKGKYICDLSATNAEPVHFTQMFVNGALQVRARFPDVDASGASQYIAAERVLPKNFIRPDFGEDIGDNVIGIEFDPATFSHKRWGQPEAATVYVRMDGKDIALSLRSIDYDRNILWCLSPAGGVTLPPGTSPEFYVDNVYEELNAVHEWYLTSAGTLYYLPSPETDMSTVVVEIPA